jgi:hypothetical protein
VRHHWPSDAEGLDGIAFIHGRREIAWKGVLVCRDELCARADADMRAHGIDRLHVDIDPRGYPTIDPEKV